MHLSATAVDNVRGVLATAHVFVKPGVAERDLWKAYRDAYGSEPFVRIVKERAGLYRYPEPKILSGSNYADVGFELDAPSGRVVAMCAIDNLMKGAAGTALQCAEPDDGMGRDARASTSRACIRSETATVHEAQSQRDRHARDTERSELA